MANGIPFKLNLHHVGIFVSDMDRSLAWYKDVLGFELAHRSVNDLPNQGLVQMAWIKNGDFYIELYQYPKKLEPFSVPAYIGSLGTKHVCFWVGHEDYRKMQEHCVAKGAKPIIDVRWPNDQSENPVRPLGADADPKTSGGVTYVVDPDGIWIEIMEEYWPGIGPVKR
jgi:catechol 2,3-dioxygenase-like lactoylglutathione lyase family enzyme